MNSLNTLFSIHAEPRDISKQAWEHLSAKFGTKFSQNESVCVAHGRDESPFPAVAPQAVVFAESAQDIQDLVRFAQQYRIPIIPYGAGTSLEGHLLAVKGGVSLDLSRMNKIVCISTQDFYATVEAGVTREQLNQAINPQGLFFPIDPGANATLGGMCATRASGTNAVRYGTLRENVLALQVINAQAGVMQLGSLSKKSAAGYDLTRLWVGSEGTLGVISQVSIKLYPLPEAISAAICSFTSVSEAVNCVIALIQLGIPIARCELLDTFAINAIKAYSQLDLPSSPVLLFEFHGSAQGVKEQTEQVQALTQEFGGGHFNWAHTPEARNKLWKARHQAYYALLQSRHQSRAISTDVCVPISKLADCVEFALNDLKLMGHPIGIKGGVIGHVGDGNFHTIHLIDIENPNEIQIAEHMNARLVHHALSLGGTCTGEHGIGLHKREFLTHECDAASMQTMRMIKQALDPLNLFNPGKIFLD